MNKVFLGIILAVCILGMLLVMLNNRLGRKPEVRQNLPVAEAPVDSRTSEEREARALEIADAERALAGPQEEPGLQSRPELAPPPEVRPPLPEQELARPEAVPVPPAPRPVLPETKPAPPEIKPPAPEVRPASPEAKPAPPATTPASPVPAQRQEGAAPGGTVTRFVVYARDNGATVRIGTNARMDYSSMTLANPDRVVVDISGNWKFPPNPGIPRNDLVSAVRVGKSADKARVVIDLKMKPRRVTLVPMKNGNGVDVRVDK